MFAKQERGTFDYTCHAKIVVRQSGNNVVACSSSINTVNPVKKCSGTSKIAMTHCDGIEKYIPLISQDRCIFHVLKKNTTNECVRCLKILQVNSFESFHSFK